MVNSKVWVNCYPKGVVDEVNLNEFSSIKDILEHSTQCFSSNTAFSNRAIWSDTCLSYAELDAQSTAFGAYLQSLHGMKKGDRVGIMLPNLLQYPIVLFGALRAGFVVVNINPLYTVRELAHQLRDAGVKIIVVLENFAHVLQQVLTKTPIEHIICTSVGEMHPWFQGKLMNCMVRHIRKMVPKFSLLNAVNMKTALAIGKARSLLPVTLTHADLAFLQYTGGTTGISKAAMLTHGNIVSNLQQVSAWIDFAVEEGKETVITALPLHHIFCLTANLLTFMKCGGHCLLITNPHDIKGMIKVLRANPFTIFTGDNTLFVELMNHFDFKVINFSSLKITLGGGAAIQKAIADRWYQLTGKPITQVYGLTECSPAVCINRLSEMFTGSVGLPLPSTLVSIRDSQFNELPLGVGGELCIKGPQVMRGYWGQPKQTNAALTIDGWFKTGDVAYLDSKGYVFITDRLKQMIRVSGFDVYSTEIEEVVVQHPQVIEAAAIGVPDEKTGEAVKVFVVAHSTLLTEEILLQHCRSLLSSYKVPKFFVFLDALPKSNVGKVLQKELK